MDLTDLPAYPHDKIGYPLRSGYSFKTRDLREVSDMMVGPGISHLISHYTVSDCAFTLRLSNGEEGYFRWWLANKINHGNSWFKMKIRTGEGLRYMPCHIASDGIGNSQYQNGSWTIACQLIVIGHPAEAMTETAAETLLQNGPGDAYSTARLNDTINGEW